MKKYRLETYHDHDTERPDTYTLGRMVSFSSRHRNYVHPDAFTEKDCPTCEGYGTIDDGPHCTNCESSGLVDCSLSEHPDVLAVLNYSEHGRCNWGVGLGRDGWDVVGVAGVIVWNGEDNEREWWGGLTDKVRKEILDGIAEEYTSWANGDVYGYILSELEECETCESVTAGEDIDSGWGFIGDRHFSDTIAEILHYLEVDPSDVETVGEAAYAVEIREMA